MARKSLKDSCICDQEKWQLLRDRPHSLTGRRIPATQRHYIKLSIETIQYLQKNPNYKGKKNFSKRNAIFYKKDFNQNIIIQINKLIKDGLVKNYCHSPKKVKIIKLK